MLSVVWFKNGNASWGFLFFLEQSLTNRGRGIVSMKLKNRGEARDQT